MKISGNKSKKELSILNEELENYFANTIIPQLFVDADLILRKFTPPAMKNFSLTKEDINRPIQDVKDNIQYPTIIENIKEVIVTHKILEKEVQTTDGKWYQMNILPYVVRKENRMDGVIITFVDITSRITTLKELEKLNAEHQIMIYNFAHDIKQPISVNMLITHQLQDAYDQQDTKRFTKWLKKLDHTSKTINFLVKEFSEDNKEEFSSVEERVNIEDIFQNVKLALRDDIYNKGVYITTEFNTSEIIFSRKKLRSIIYNLLNNAIKFRKPDEPLEIIITTEKIQDYVLLSVRDSGIGITEKNLKTIFKKSARLHKKIEGTGMGLYIVKQMVKNNGGKVEAQSTLGKGSVFNVYFKSGYKGEETEWK